jgi:drug/metabolite transporter (DMT)-like permease
VTLLLSFQFLKRERVDGRLVAAVATTVSGVVLLLIT